MTATLRRTRKGDARKDRKRRVTFVRRKPVPPPEKKGNTDDFADPKISFERVVLARGKPTKEGKKPNGN